MSRATPISVPEPPDLDTLWARVEAVRNQVREAYLDESQDFPWIVGFSGGKDSTVLLQIVFEVVAALPSERRRRPIHVLANDTLVESPPMAQHLDRVLEEIRQSVPKLGLPVRVSKVSPATDQTFWVNLIGRGYPAPNRQFRWCTDRMKIAPTSKYIRDQVAGNGKVILLLGVRRSESSARARSAARYGVAGTYSPHNDLQGCLVYRPILEITTPEIWVYLLQCRPPWGGTHRQLVTLYRNAGGGECPLVIDKESAPSCGTTSPRFGCWTCTVVEKDRSLRGFIEAGSEELEPLGDFRDWLAVIRNDPDSRLHRRRNGTAGLGPFTLPVRRTILRKLLDLQKELEKPLISDAEIAHIREIWVTDELSDLQRQLKLLT